MLCIAVNYDGETRWATHHIGDGILSSGIGVDDIYRVQADGDELNAILKQITGIPFASAAVQTWYGDHAKFIAANIRL
jgi:hypothetical protein